MERVQQTLTVIRKMLNSVLIILFIAFFSSGSVKAQDENLDIYSYEDVVNLCVSDTLTGANCYLPIKIKYKNNLDIMIYAEQTWVLFKYFYEINEWSGDAFYKTMKSYVLNDKPLIIEDTAFFRFNNLYSEKQCSCLFKTNDVEMFIKNETPPPREALFACLVYKLLKLNILVRYVEGKIVFSDFRDNR